MTKKDFLRKIIAKNGTLVQQVVAMEEMVELTKELSKSIRGDGNHDAIVEEVADVYITLMQIEIIHSIDLNELFEMIDKKMKRLKERLEEDEFV